MRNPLKAELLNDVKRTRQTLLETVFRAPGVSVPNACFLLDPLESESVRRLSRNLILTYCATRKWNLDHIAGCTAEVQRGGIESLWESLDPS